MIDKLKGAVAPIRQHPVEIFTLVISMLLIATPMQKPPDIIGLIVTAFYMLKIFVNVVMLWGYKTNTYKVCSKKTVEKYEALKPGELESWTIVTMIYSAAVVLLKF